MSLPYGTEYPDQDVWADEDGTVHNGWKPEFATAPEYQAPTAEEIAARHLAGDHDAGPTTWEPFDLGPYLRGEITPPSLGVGVRRTDGLQMLYPGREHWINGEMESGKSWFTLACAAAELEAGRTVAVAHFEEDDPASTVERLLLLGVPGQVIQRGLRFATPTRAAAAGALAPLLADPAPSLVILDGVNEGMSLHRDKVLDVEGVAAWRRRVVKPCTAVGAAVLQADHVSVGEGRERYSFGSQHKANGANGVVLRLENADPFGRGRRGRSHVYVTKDRPGELRRHGRAGGKVNGKTFIGELVVDDSQLEHPELRLCVFAPNPEATAEEDHDPAAPVRDALVGVLGQLPDKTARTQRLLLAAMREAGHRYRKSAMTDALDELVVSGDVIEAPGRNRSTSYALSGASQQRAF